MADWTKWVSAGLGWAMFGPIGGVVGYFVGKNLDGDKAKYKRRRRSVPPEGQYRPHVNDTTPGDFAVSMVVLIAAVIRADGQVRRSEVDYARVFFQRNFPPAKAAEFSQMLEDVLTQDFSLRQVTLQIRQYMDHDSRLEVLHILFGLAASDDEIHSSEMDVLLRISNYMAITKADFDSIRNMFGSVADADADYLILEVDSNASDTEVKAAYRRMAKKYHPDKIEHLGEDFKTIAEEKFKAVNDAYHRICQQRRSC